MKKNNLHFYLMLWACISLELGLANDSTNSALNKQAKIKKEFLADLESFKSKIIPDKLKFRDHRKLVSDEFKKIISKYVGDKSINLKEYTQNYHIIFPMIHDNIKYEFLRRDNLEEMYDFYLKYATHIANGYSNFDFWYKEDSNVYFNRSNFYTALSRMRELKPDAYFTLATQAWAKITETVYTKATSINFVDSRMKQGDGPWEDKKIKAYRRNYSYKVVLEAFEEVEPLVDKAIKNNPENHPSAYYLKYQIETYLHKNKVEAKKYLELYLKNLPENFPETPLKYGFDKDTASYSLKVRKFELESKKSDLKRL